MEEVLNWIGIAFKFSTMLSSVYLRQANVIYVPRNMEKCGKVWNWVAYWILEKVEWHAVMFICQVWMSLCWLPINCRPCFFSPFVCREIAICWKMFQLSSHPLQTNISEVLSPALQTNTLKYIFYWNYKHTVQWNP